MLRTLAATLALAKPNTTPLTAVPDAAAGKQTPADRIHIFDEQNIMTARKN